MENTILQGPTMWVQVHHIWVFYIIKYIFAGVTIIGSSTTLSCGDYPLFIFEGEATLQGITFTSCYGLYGMFVLSTYNL